MDDDNDKEHRDRSVPEAEIDIAGEIRRGRKFTTSEALGRAAADSLKGASPVAPLRQLLSAIDHLLEIDLEDDTGALGRTLLARCRDNPPLLARHFGEPENALRELLDEILTNESALTELVRQTDARWGREFAERPHFERAGRPADPDDPYTIAGVRAALTRCRNKLSR